MPPFETDTDKIALGACQTLPCQAASAWGCYRGLVMLRPGNFLGQKVETVRFSCVDKPRGALCEQPCCGDRLGRTPATGGARNPVSDPVVLHTQVVPPRLPVRVTPPKVAGVLTP